MRNLKKILALVLAMVMTFSVMATANAFTDSADIDADYAESVDVLAALGVLKGYEVADDEYAIKPQNSITRAEVAAMIYRIATGDVEDEDVALYAGAAKFTDAIPAWAAGYIGYCANAGYIKGYEDGSFRPAGLVTGFEALVMILRAVGYDKLNEFSGAEWSTNAASIAKQLGVTDDIKPGVLVNAASREVVAEILFEAINVAQVTYTPAFGYQNQERELWGADNSTIGEDSFGLKMVKGQVMMGTNKNVILGNTKRETLAKLTSDYAFEIGRNGHVWTASKGVNKGTLTSVYYSDTLLATVYDGDYAGWTTAATKTTAAAENFVAKADSTTGVRLFINGVQKDAKDLRKGAEVRLFDDNQDGDIDLVIALQETVEVVGTKGVKVTTGKNAKDYVVVDGVVASTAVSAVVGYENLVAKDVVLAVTMPTDITYLTKAAAVEGQMTKRNIRTNEIYFNNEWYTESGLLNTDVVELFHSGNANANVDYVLWLDRGGYAVYDAEVVDPYTYAVVLDSYYVHTNSKTTTYYADLLFVDGTVEEDVVVTKDAYAHEGEWVTYTINSKGNYALTNVNTAIIGDVEIDGKTAALGNWRTTEDTIYLVQTGTPGNYTYDAYVGFDAVPALTAHGLNVVDAAYNTAGGYDVASHVYVASSDLYTLKDMLIYTLNTQDIISYKDSKGDSWYEIPVLVNGEDDILLMDSVQFIESVTHGALKIGFYEDVLVDTADGQLVALALTAGDATYTSDVEDIDYARATVQLDGKVWNAGDAAIYYVANRTYEKVELDSDYIGLNSHVVYFTSGKYITEMYILPANVKVDTYSITVNNYAESMGYELLSADGETIDANNVLPGTYHLHVKAKEGYDNTTAKIYVGNDKTEVAVVPGTNRYDIVVTDANVIVEIHGAADAIEYDIEYANVDGSNFNEAEAPANYTVVNKADKIAAINAIEPAKVGYGFKGWSIETVADGTMTATAAWEQITYYVTFNYVDPDDVPFANETKTIEVKGGEDLKVHLSDDKGNFYLVDDEVYYAEDIFFIAAEDVKTQTITVKVYDDAEYGIIRIGGEYEETIDNMVITWTAEEQTIFAKKGGDYVAVNVILSCDALPDGAKLGTPRVATVTSSAGKTYTKEIKAGTEFPFEYTVAVYLNGTANECDYTLTSVVAK